MTGRINSSRHIPGHGHIPEGRNLADARVRFQPSVAETIRLIAFNRGCSFAEIVREAVDQYLGGLSKDAGE